MTRAWLDDHTGYPENAKRDTEEAWNRASMELQEAFSFHVPTIRNEWRQDPDTQQFYRGTDVGAWSRKYLENLQIMIKPPEKAKPKTKTAKKKRKTEPEIKPGNTWHDDLDTYDETEHKKRNAPNAVILKPRDDRKKDEVLGRQQDTWDSRMPKFQERSSSEEIQRPRDRKDGSFSQRPRKAEINKWDKDHYRGKNYERRDRSRSRSIERWNPRDRSKKDANPRQANNEPGSKFRKNLDAFYENSDKRKFIGNIEIPQEVVPLAAWPACVDCQHQFPHDPNNTCKNNPTIDMDGKVFCDYAFAPMSNLCKRMECSKTHDVWLWKALLPEVVLKAKACNSVYGKRT